MRVDAPGTVPTAGGAIQHAANVTGTNFEYLLATAQVESNLNPAAEARTSSARGLFQFVEQTWLTMLKEQGATLGYGQYTDAISRDTNGRYRVSDPQAYREIMALRSDPTANAVMAGIFTRQNADSLTAKLGRSPTEGELYLAHFLGASGAGRLISLAENKPGVRAADIFPHAARANRSIFFDKSGRARSVLDVYRVMTNRYAVARGGPADTAVQVAQITPSPQALQGQIPDTAGTTAAYAAAGPAPVRVAAAGPVFHGLFRSAGDNDVIAPVVSSLWSTPGASPSIPSAASEPASGRPLDLFQEQATDARALFRGRV